MPAFKDLTGKRFGKLVVQYKLSEKKNNKIQWHCICDCGNEKDIVGTSLTKNNGTKSCGCLQKEKTREANQSQDLSGKQYGYLTVIERVPNSSKWKCLCKCGNIIITNTNHLNTGHTKSCGCLQKEKTSETHFNNLTGKHFGLLEVLGLDLDLSKPGVKYYKCQCECGNIVSKKGVYLISGTQSCGCKIMSRGEIKIYNLLKEYGISFEREKTFKDCINPKTNRALRFDFFIDNKYLIEYNGKQHYTENDCGWDESLEDIQYRDNLKIEWAKKNNIPLIIIPYTKYEDLTIDDLLLS